MKINKGKAKEKTHLPSRSQSYTSTLTVLQGGDMDRCKNHRGGGEKGTRQKGLTF